MRRDLSRSEPSTTRISTPPGAHPLAGDRRVWDRRQAFARYVVDDDAESPAAGELFMRYVGRATSGRDHESLTLEQRVSEDWVDGGF